LCTIRLGFRGSAGPNPIQDVFGNLKMVDPLPSGCQEFNGGLCPYW